jgi:hypothetical protein
MLLKAWIDSVLKPQLQASLRDGLPLRDLGESLIGYGAAVLVKGCKLSHDDVRKVLEAVMANDDIEPPAGAG